jgi:hypothetical protein
VRSLEQRHASIRARYQSVLMKTRLVAVLIVAIFGFRHRSSPLSDCFRIVAGVALIGLAVASEETRHHLGALAR